MAHVAGLERLTSAKGSALPSTRLYGYDSASISFESNSESLRSLTIFSVNPTFVAKTRLAAALVSKKAN